MIEHYIDEILKLRNEGKKTSEIAKILNIQANTLRAYFYHHRDIFPKLGRYRHIDELESREMHKEFYIDGMTKKAISIKHNVDVGTVRRHINMIDFMNTLNPEH